jgi:hypothetical protein
MKSIDPKRRLVRATGYNIRDRGRYKEVIAKVTPEGIYLKLAGCRWSGAWLCTWAAAVDVAVARMVRIKKEEKAKRRKLRLTGGIL